MNKKIILLSIFFATGIFYSYSEEKDNPSSYVKTSEDRQEDMSEENQDIHFEESIEENSDEFEDDLFRGVEIENKKLTLKEYVKIAKEYIKQNKKAQIGIGTGLTALTILAILKYNKKI